MDIVHGILALLVVSFAYSMYWYLQAWRSAQDGFVSASTRAKHLEEENVRWQKVFQATQDRLTKYMEQNSSLAQQLATLRVKHNAEPEERTFELLDTPEPYSEELEEFLSGIASIEAVEVLEEEIEAMRAAGKSDTEILARIRLGD